VVEERVQSSQVQKEVECLNEDILKNLIDEELVKPPANELRRMPITSQSAQLSNQSTSTIDSSDDGVLTETYYNGSK